MSTCSQKEGDHKARRWFRREVWKSLPGFLKNSLYWRIAMFKNYLMITLRNIRSQKGYSFINIVGLSIGIAIFLLISSYVKNELSFDSFHADLDRIYQVGSAENNGHLFLWLHSSCKIYPRSSRR